VQEVLHYKQFILAQPDIGIEPEAELADNRISEQFQNRIAEKIILKQHLEQLFGRSGVFNRVGAAGKFPFADGQRPVGSESLTFQVEAVIFGC